MMSDSAPVLCIGLTRPGSDAVTLRAQMRRLAAQRPGEPRRTTAAEHVAAGAPERRVSVGQPGPPPSSGLDEARALLEVAVRLGCHTVLISGDSDADAAVPIELAGLVDEVFVTPASMAQDDDVAHALLDAYGDGGFVYADCHEGDLVLWGFGESERMSAPLLSALGGGAVGKRPTAAALWARQLRVHQW